MYAEVPTSRRSLRHATTIRLGLDWHTVGLLQS